MLQKVSGKKDSKKKVLTMMVNFIICSVEVNILQKTVGHVVFYAKEYLYIGAHFVSSNSEWTSSFVGWTSVVYLLSLPTVIINFDFDLCF